MSSWVASSSARRRASSPSPVVMRCSSATAASRSVHASFHAASTLLKRASFVLGAAARGLGRDLEVALDDAQRLFGADLLGPGLPLRILLVAEPLGVLVEQAVVVEERAAQAVELVDDPRVLVVDPFDLGGQLGTRLGFGRDPRLRGALLLAGTQALDLAAERRGRALGFRPRRGLFLEQLALFLHDAARLFGRAQVAAGQGLHFGQPFAGTSAPGHRGGVDRDGIDGQDRCRGQRRAGPFGQHFVEEEFARTAGLGRAEVGGRYRIRGGDHGLIFGVLTLAT